MSREPATIRVAHASRRRGLPGAGGGRGVRDRRDRRAPVPGGEGRSGRSLKSVGGVKGTLRADRGIRPTLLDNLCGESVLGAE